MAYKGWGFDLYADYLKSVIDKIMVSKEFKSIYLEPKIQNSSRACVLEPKICEIEAALNP